MRSPVRDWDVVARAAIAVGAAIRGLVVLDLYPPYDHIYSDSLGYIDRAVRVATAAPLDRYDAFYPPGTHLLLAIPLWLFGPDRTGVVADAALWATLSALTPYFMWRYARLLLSPAAAALTAAFCAVWPIHIAYAGHFMSEVPALTLLCASLWLAERLHQTSSRRSAIAAGMAGGLAIAQRPALLLNLIVAAWPLATNARVFGARLALLVLGVALALVPVVAYASAASGNLTLSENSGLVFYMGHCPVRAVEAGPPSGVHYSFESPVNTQLGRGTDVSFPDHPIWDQTFFYSQGLACVANDGLGHVHVLLRNIFDMGLTTVPWPPSNDPVVRDLVRTANVAYVVLLPFIIIGTISLIRRRRRVGGGRGELVMLVQLSTILVTALLYFGDPRYRTPYDVFGLALAAALIADRFFDGSPTRTRYPDVRADDAIEEHDERGLGGRESVGKVDPYEPSPAEADGAPAVGAHHDPP